MVAWEAFRSTLQQNKADESDGNNKQRTLRDFPGDPVAKIQRFHSRGAHVPSPARELRSCMPSREQPKKKKTIKQNFRNALKILVPKNWCLQIVALEKTLENLLDCKENKPVDPKGNQPWIFPRRTDGEAPIRWPPDEMSQLTGKGPDAGKDWG